ncbi:MULTISPECIES: bifunctional acetate--CoA ligase family protein/GNAT family N-acetyltransferase [unclassified Mesorhizobium]|uniref:bifunctional acetate--CoA ligase family protein/GNAT family N-acetyltransferase n=1 Tax=unclassified Mesorhizobium TaxID=325217 RepID=UPI000FCB2A64|nr:MULTISPECIES: bifunctional acetate--CoA ligase family protein/GNAT family N-acetyltransferase [unclassified Mesorhizobium]RUV55276.1 GNAT family N-acetyltransferase [Mesorhizobium sp. M5C.F.Ca.IN.020.29.1.1]RWH71682.1 MAG: GNAT family N-acetyltransferase [Mesorhizobium sp.]RWH85659.1 MAG: GNAT family N-acetyltransferase [Mesorhizobium sp.]RWH90916.1 MAG: GNAT family N-acetyltransferase [Mesorhizobium sp.]RWH99598.1 MAG: GNAT family N-acetyltransferase [Mesorhizobium sp.]
MTIRNLEHAFAPKSVAVFGASGCDGSVGRVVFDNLVNGGFEGEIWPVNPKYSQVAGRRCYAKAADLPAIPDLGVIVTPPQTVPGIIRDLGEKGTRAAVVITAGLTRENGLRQAMLDASKATLLRIIGPNTLGLMIPPVKLNAGFAHMAARPGNIALLSQSGAIATSVIDWAADNNVGFSQIISLGDMADVDVGDCLDMLAGDARTRAIVMYLETISNPRKFMSAARAAARIKPVIAIKSGRHEQAAKATATHTGALSGADRVVEAALLRAGILRVKGLTELFDAVETTARFAPLQRARVGIVTNGGGAGVLAVDQLIDCNGELAELSPETIARLEAVLPATWSHANPVDIIGDASPERYRVAIEAVAADTGTDVVLVMNCPTGLGSPLAAASAVATLARDGKIGNKPVLTCWLGEHTAREGRRVLQDAGIASFETPADAATAVSYLSDWSRAQRALMRVPPSRSEDTMSDREAVLAIFRQVAKEGRRMLTEPEAKAAISAYGVPVPETIVAKTASEAEKAAGRLLKRAEQVVVKLLSKAISHKSDIGGVVLNLATAAAAGKAARSIEARVRKQAPQAIIEGYTVQPMVVRKQAHELILGMSCDPIFGPVVLFGAGGVAVEVMDDIAFALPPLDDVLAGDLIEQTRTGRLLAGFRDHKPANRGAIVAALNGLSQMIVDFPCIVSLDINPLLADADGVIALDARIEIEPGRVEKPGPNPALAIRPYPSGWNRDVSVGGAHYHIRPIKPADIALYPQFLARISPDDLRLRFLSPRKNFSDQMLKRLTQLDYDRDMAFVALEASTGALAGVSRLSCDPDHTVAEYALLVRTDLQGHGLGWELLRQIVDYAKADGIGRIEGIMLNENTKMLAMCREFGFSVGHHPSEPGLAEATLELR